MRPKRVGIPRLAWPLALFATSLLTPLPAAAQIEVTARSSSLRLGGRLHFQVASSSAEDRTTPEFFVRRARLIADISVTDFLDGRLQPSFVIGSVQLEDAYFRLKFHRAFQLYFGQFKQAFDIFESTSSTELNVVERSGDIPGISVCPGVSGICSYGRFAARLQYGGRDTGIRADGRFGGDRWAYAVTVTNGEGIFENSDPNGRKSTSARLTFRPIGPLALSASVNIHDYAVDRGDEEVNHSTTAWNADLQWGDFRDGLVVQVGFMGGGNWKVLDEFDDPATFFTTQAIASYYHALPEGGRLAGIEPALRLSYGDPDTENGDDNAGFLITPGFNLYVFGRNRINTNLDIWAPSEGDSEWSLRMMTYLYF